MRVLSFLLLINLTLNSYSQEKITDSINTNWEKSGKFTFLGNQSSYSYWTAGGQTSVSGTIKINYDLNYENNGWNWDTKIITAYGLNRSGGSKFLKKTDDKLEINSLVGKKFSSSNIGDLSYSSFINFKTQWTKGYRFRTTSSGEEERIERTRFLSPGYFQIGVGLYWEKNKDFWVNFAPITGRLILVNKFFTDKLNENQEYFGVKKGSTSRFELGSSIRSYYKFEFLENVFVINRLSLYSDYLENPENIDLDYTINTSLKVNKYLTTDLILQFIYDNNAVKRLQVRQVMGIGLSLNF